MRYSHELINTLHASNLICLVKEKENYRIFLQGVLCLMSKTLQICSLEAEG